MKTIEHIRDFLDAFTLWASERVDVHGLALVGSHARGAARDESDIDLVILTDQPGSYLDDLHWIEHFGAAEKHQIKDYVKLRSVRVWYQNGLEVEYGITVTNSPILSSKICANNHVTTAVFSFTIPHYLIETSYGQISTQKCIVSCPYHVYIKPSQLCLPVGILAGDPAGGNDELVYS
jgi:predicted nucleotidyltransferase